MANQPGGASGLMDLTTLGELFAWRVAQTPDGEAYRQFDPAGAKWVSYSWAETARQVAAWQRGLAALRLESGARVAILLPNGVHAVCVDQAVLALGMAPVPLHAIDNPDSIAYIVKDCDASVLVVSARAQWDAIAAVPGELPNLKLVVVVGEDATVGQAAAKGAVKVVSLAELQAGAQQMEIDAAKVTGEDLAAIVYTSGTTGKPKGVMLTHANVMSNVHAVMGHVSVLPSDVFLSFLPLSHTFERTIGYYIPIAAGSCVAYVRSVAQIAEDLKTVRPTVLVSVPRIYERFFAKLQETLSHAGGFTRTLFAMGEASGWRQFCRRQGLPFERSAVSSLDWLLAPLLHAVVGRKVLAQFGGRLRFAVSGGAPMSQAVAQCFLGMGLPLLQGYGMTETSPVVSANKVVDNRPTTVGRPLNGVQVRIGELSELQVRGPGVMKGYWKRPEDTANAMTADGWLRTGDQAVIEEERIRIVGRIKEIIVTSTGEKIPPGDLELAIGADPLFDQVFVIGENRPFIAAFVVLNKALWEGLAASIGIDAATGLDSEPARAAVLERIQAATRGFPIYAVPRGVRLTLEPWSIQNGLMTPTLKLKRKALNARFEAEIEDVYAARAR
jgi:long-chain acyl-CoA synthetase